MEKTHTQKRIEQMREELRLGHAPKLVDFLWLMERVEFYETERAEVKESRKPSKVEEPKPTKPGPKGWQNV